MPVMSTVAKVKLRKHVRKRCEVGSSDNTGSAGETQRFYQVKIGCSLGYVVRDTAQ